MSLTIAAINGNLNEIVRIFYTSPKTNPDVKDEFKMTPLHHASKKGYIDIVKILLEKEATINIQDDRDNTPLAYAVSNGHIEIVALLLKSGAQIETRNCVNYTPLHLAAACMYPDIVELLLLNLNPKANFDILAAQDNEGDTPLHKAVNRNHLKIATLLLDAMNDKASAHGFNAAGYLAIKDYGMDINQKPRMSYTPIDLARTNRFHEMAELLDGYHSKNF